MNSLDTLESSLAHWFAPAPHLPAAVRRWIVENIWWIVLVIAILASFGLLIDVPQLLNTAALTTAAYNSIYPYKAVPLSAVVISGACSLGLGIVSVVLLYLAVKPLRHRRLLGWRLLFATRFVAVVAALATFIILIQSFSLYGLLWDLAFILIEVYVLFEIRDEYRRKTTRRAGAKRTPASRAGTRKPAARKK